MHEWRLEAQGKGLESVLALDDLEAWTAQMREFGEKGLSAFNPANEWVKLQRTEPKVTFEGLDTRFHNHLSQQHLLDFNRDDVDRFVDELAKRTGNNS